MTNISDDKVDRSSRQAYGCPNSSSQNVVEQAFVPVEYTGSFLVNEKGEPEFEPDATEAKVFWDCEEPEKPPYRCRDCSHEFSEPVVVTAARYKEMRARNHAR